MNFTKKPLIATAVVFIIMNIFSFIIHQKLLNADYNAMKGVFRPMAEISIPVLTIAYLISAIAFVQIFLKGQENGTFLSEGIRFGLLISLFAIVPMYLMNFAVIPYTLSAIIKLIVFETIALVVSGIAAAYLLKE